MRTTERLCLPLAWLHTLRGPRSPRYPAIFLLAYLVALDEKAPGKGVALDYEEAERVLGISHNVLRRALSWLKRQGWINVEIRALYDEFGLLTGKALIVRIHREKLGLPPGSTGGNASGAP